MAIGVEMRININRLKNKIAKQNGYILDLPDKWGYAMLLTHRTKKQLGLYEQVILDLVELFEKNKDENIKKLCSEICSLHDYENLDLIINPDLGKKIYELIGILQGE